MKIEMLWKKFGVIFLFILSCAGYRNEDFYPIPITTSENTYIRFRFENKRTEEEKQLLKDKDRYWKFFSYGFRVKMWDRDELFTNFKEFRIINPTREYWQKYYRNDRKFRDRAIIAIDFVEGCDYKMPIPVGKRKYKFSFGSEEPHRLAMLVKTLEVPPNHSVWVTFDIDGPPQEGDEEELDRGAYFKKRQIPMRVKIAPNPDPDEDKICEIPND